MAFAAARMIMPKDKAQRKPSSDFQGKGKVREELKKYLFLQYLLISIRVLTLCI